MTIAHSRTTDLAAICRDAVSTKAGWITPMPGSTGPMTVACMMENTLSAARLQGRLP